MSTQTCPGCGKEHEGPDPRYGDPGHLFCSYKCWTKVNEDLWEPFFVRFLRGGQLA